MGLKSGIRFLLLMLCVCFIALGHHLARADVMVEGLENNPDLQDYINDIVDQREEDADTPVRLEADILQALKAKGYYDGLVTDEQNEAGDLVFKIDAGEAYTINEIIMDGDYDLQSALLAEGEILDAYHVLEAQREIYDSIEADACYYNLDVSHEVVLDEETKSARLTFIISGQPGAKFGATSFEGAPDIERTYLREFISYNEGDCWKRQTLEDTKAALYGTGLLASAQADLPENLPEDGFVPVDFTVKQRAFRTIGLGAGYNTSDGAGISASWEHRNLFGGGEKLSLKARLYEIVQTIDANYIKPFFLRSDQKLTLNSTLNRENNDAYKELSYDVGGAITRQLTDEIALSLGANYELSRIEDEDGEDSYGLFSVPASFNYDNRDNILDPHEGWRVDVSTAPFFDTLGEAPPFWKSRFTASTYFDLSRSAFDPVLALKGSFGTIQGADADDVPANKRFYAGGGGSIRGFGYQDVGPRDVDGDPSGGLSVIEMTAEFRAKATETIGFVAFLDAGQVYEDIMPDFDTEFAVGVGIGARYYTAIGPIRFDVATPINRRDQADSSYQIYLSIGQAF